MSAEPPDDEPTRLTTAPLDTAQLTSRVAPEPGLDAARRRWLLVLLAIMVLGCAGRVVYALSHDDAPVNGDSYAYHGGANLLADGRGYIDPYRLRDEHIEWQTADHPPLYILYLAGWSSIGVDTPRGHRLASVLLGTATIAIVAFGARRWFGEHHGDTAGLIAAGIAAANPNFWFYDGSLHAETMAQLTAAGLLWAAAVMVRNPSRRAAVVLGAVAALGALSRSELLALVPFVVVPCAAGWLRMRDRAAEQVDRAGWRRRVVDAVRRTRWAHLVLAGVAFAVLMAPWVAFNQSRFDRSAPLGNGYGITLLSGNCPLTYSGQFMAYWAKPCVDASAARVRATGVDQSVFDAEMRKEGLEFISKHKARFVVVSVARVARVFGFFRPRQTQALEHFPDGREVWVAHLGSDLWYVVAALALTGAVVARRRGVPVSPFAAPPVAVALAVFTTVATTRYRSIVEVPAAMLAGLAIAWLVARIRSRASDTAIDPG